MASSTASSLSAILPFSSTSVHARLPSRISPLRIACLSKEESALVQAAKHTVVDSYVKNGMRIGLGAGTVSDLAIQYLGHQVRAGKLRDIVGVPTSVGSASEAAKAGIPLEQYKESSNIDLAFDDADVIEEETLSAVIGRQKMVGEDSIIQEKTILRVAQKLVFNVTEKQYKSDLDGSIPVLIQPFNWMETAEEIDDLFLGDAEVWRRSFVGHADPLGGDFPLVTKEGHNVLDVIFTSPILSLAAVADSLDQIDGVVEHGIICRTRCTAVIATENGLRVIEHIPMTESGRSQ